MRAFILNTSEFAEFGKTDTVVVTMTINSTEARRILEELPEVWKESAALTVLWSLLSAIENGPMAQRSFNDRHAVG